MISLFISSLGRGAASAAPIDPYAASDGSHYFMVVGDSISNGTNARTNEPTPDPNGALKEWDGTALNTVLDTATANDGSQYPNFAINYKTLTGKGVIVSECGLGGSEWILNNDANHWDAGGNLYAPAVTKTNDGLTATGAPKLRGVILILGINDARGAKPITDIKTGMTSLIDRLNTDFGTPPIYIVNIGREENGYTTRVRDVQKLIDNADSALVFNDGLQHGIGLVQRYSNIKLADNLERYEALGYYHTDNLHLTQAGNNYLGEQLATFIKNN